MLLTLPVAFHCIFILGFQTANARVLVHSILGTLIYGVIAVKLWFVHDRDHPRKTLPFIGSAVFLDAGRALGHVEPLVLHECAIRFLTCRRWRRTSTCWTRRASAACVADVRAVIARAGFPWVGRGARAAVRGAARRRDVAAR